MLDEFWDVQVTGIIWVPRNKNCTGTFKNSVLILSNMKFFFNTRISNHVPDLPQKIGKNAICIWIGSRTNSFGTD